MKAQAVLIGLLAAAFLALTSYAMAQAPVAASAPSSAPTSAPASVPPPAATSATQPASTAKSAAAPSAILATSVPGETKEQHDARMAWWREARFGMFIHWGVYSVPAGTYQGKQIGSLGEWIMNNGRIPVAEYANFAAQFNPVKFDAEEIVKTARDAGMKYIVITAKHHDGFAMFHTAVDGYNIFDATPFKRDPLKELAAACAKYGIKLGFYYSQSQDWHHPGGAALPPAVNRPNPALPNNHWDPAAQDGDYDAYLKNVALPQVKELLSNYGPIAVFWFDTPVNMTAERVAQFLPLLKLQPNIIVNNRLSNDRKIFPGDTETPEQNIPATGYADGRDWETCMTINDTWGYKSYDTNFKSAQTLLQNLVDCASKGGNYLLNVGPTSEGVIPQPELDRLKTMGEWMKINGEAIYGTSASTFPAVVGVNAAVKQGKTQTDFGQWRATTKPGKIYIVIFKWPDGKFDLAGVKGQVSKAWLLADPDKKALAISQDGEKLSVTLPDKAPDPIASVLCLELGESK